MAWNETTREPATSDTANLEACRQLQKGQN